MSDESATSRAGRRWRLGGLLAVAYALRVGLACRGGQGFWPDEGRYDDAREAAYELVHGHGRLAADALLGHADHLLFRWFALPTALLEQLIGNHSELVACYLGLFSTFAIYLIWAVARRAGGDEVEALWAAYLAACANTLFYYSRHLFPYDIALAAMLAALWLALGPWSARRSFLAGAVVGVGFLTYNGYWLLGGCILILHVILGAGGLKRAAARAVCAGAGLVAVIAAVVGAGRALGHDLIEGLRQSGSVIRGDFYLGYRIIPEFLWQAEGGLLLLWLAAFAYALGAAAWGRRSSEAPHRGAKGDSLGRLAWYVGGLLLIGAGLIFFSDVVPQFMVQGRLVRSLVPFLCLGAAVGVRRFVAGEGRSRRGRAAAVAAGAGILAAWNFSTPLSLTFPDQFIKEAAGIAWQTERTQPALLRLLDASRLPGAQISADPQRRTVLLRRKHPLQFQPYLFEGFTEAQRRNLRDHDIAMRLVRLDGIAPPAPRFDGYPGPWRVRLKFPADRTGQSEPLVTSGSPGRACFLYVSYVDADHVRFGYDCWGAGGLVSAPVPVDYGAEHELLLFFGGMLPPSGRDGRTESEALRARLAGDLLVTLDGRIVLAERVSVNPSPPERITLGVNFAGGSSASECFNGEWQAVQAADLAEVAARLPYVAAGSVRAEQDWEGYPGPVRLSIDLPPEPRSGAEPLVTTGTAGAADGLYLIYEPAGAVRLGFAHTGEAAAISAPLLPGPTGHLDLLVSMGGLFPPEGSPFYAGHRDLAALHETLLVQADGRTVFARAVSAYPSDPETIGFLSNPAGLAGVRGYFTGRWEPVRPADVAEVLGSVTAVSRVVGSPDPAWRGYSGPLRLKLRFPPQPAGVSEPLLVSGESGRGDFVYVRYEGSGRLRLGFDHWGVGGSESAVVNAGGPDREHELVISQGALFPPTGDDFYRRHPGWERLRDWLVVAWDGRPLLVAPVRNYPAAPDQISVGFNPLGGSTAGLRFSGDIISVRSLTPDAILPWVKAAQPR